MKNLKKFVAIIALGICSISSAWAQIPVTDFAGLVQWVMDGVVQGEQLYTQIEQLENQAKMMESQTKTLGSSSNSSASSDMQRATSAAQTSRQMYDKTKAFGGADAPSASSREAIQANKDIINANRQELSADQDALNGEAQRIDSLANQSQAAGGTLEAQQAGNQINVEMVQQVQKMRSQMMRQEALDIAEKNQAQQKREGATKAIGAFSSNTN